MFSLIRREPVRAFEIVVALVALAAFYYPDLPVPLIVGLAGALLGVGEAVRSNVYPAVNVVDEAEFVDAVSTAYGFQPASFEDDEV